MDFDFKVPSTVPQDLLLIQDLIGTLPPLPVAEECVPDSQDPSDDDSIASTDSDVQSEDEVEAGLTLRDDDSGPSIGSSSSDSHTSSSSDSEEEDKHTESQRRIPPDDIEDEELGMRASATYLQTKNEIVDTNVIVPTISEVEPCDILEKVGEIMSIIGDIVIVKGLPVDHVNSLTKRALDAESLLVFEDRKVLGYIYETFGPTSQPLYQVKFNQHYPLDTNKVWVSREVFHVPHRSHFVFVDQLKNIRGSDASNIHDEEPAEDEIEFSDDEKEAAFRAQRKKRRGRSVSSSSHPTPVPPRIHLGDMFRDAPSNPYDAHGPYDDDYHVTGPSRPPPVPYDDPYSDAPISDPHVHRMEMSGEFEEGSSCENGGSVLRSSRGRVSSRSTHGRGARNHQLYRGTPRRGQRHRPVAPQRTFDSDTGQSFPEDMQTVECAIGYGQIGDAITSQPLVQPVSNAWLSSEANNSIQGYGRPFIQPHINPRFASMFGLNLPSEPMIPSWWTSQNAQGQTFPPHHWVDEWTMHGSAGSEGEGDTYRPM